MRQEKPVNATHAPHEAASDVPHALRTIGPYEVRELLGSGGMGEVYKAYDQRLERWVAIKRIRPDKESAEEHRERLRREARAAARINHPSIVQVYDIFEQDDADCIVMEFVEGTSLDRLIQHGPLDPTRAVKLGRQIARGLGQAHKTGILHRDLKTENVIVTAGDHAKILDFGLAKPLISSTLDTNLTGKGQVVGTSRTMSPEYVSGDEVDHRSDLFALGVLLYETTTGNSPFKAHNTLATLKRVILHRQPPVHEVNPAVPEGLAALIDSLLEKEPQDRPQSAEDVAEALGAFLGGSSTSVERLSSGSGSFAGWQPPQRSNKFWWLVAALMVVALAFTFWLGQRDGDVRRGSVEEPLLLVLADFVNGTEDENLQGLNDALRLGLAQSDSLGVLSASEVRASLERMKADPEQHIDRRNAIEIARREGVDGVLSARIDRIGADAPFRLSAEVVDPESGRSVLVAREAAEDKSDVVPALDRIVDRLANELGELDRGRLDRRPLERVTTSSLEALQAYSLGIQSFERAQYNQAISLLEEAIALDPGFAMAHAKLGTAYRNQGREPEKAVEHLERALELEERLTQEESLYVRSWVATLGARPLEALEAWRKMRELLPKRFSGHHNFALTSWTYFNQFEAAAEAIEEAIAIKPYGYAYYHLGYVQLGQNRWDESNAAFEKARDLNLALAAIGLVEVELSRYDLDAATSALEAARATVLTEVPEYLFQSLQMRLMILQGDLEGAMRVARAVVRQAFDLETAAARPELETRLLLLALLDRHGSPTVVLDQEIRLAAERAIESGMSGEIGQEFSKSLFLASLGKIAARHGSIMLAKELREQMRRYLPSQLSGVWRGQDRMLDAEIMMAEGDFEGAQDALGDPAEWNGAYYATETLSTLLERRGDIQDSREWWKWLYENRGRAFAECGQLCFERQINALVVPLAILAHARLTDESGAEASLISTLPRAWHPTE